MKKYTCDRCDKEFGTRDALDMHNKTKHPESYKEPLLSKKQKKKIMIYGIIILVILVIGWFVYIKSIPPEDAPIMEINPKSYNFGTVSQAKGTVSTEMTIANTGKSDLIINNIK